MRIRISIFVCLLSASKMVGKVGFEPTQPKATDLQSAVTLQLHRLPFTSYTLLQSAELSTDSSSGSPYSDLISVPH